MGFASYLEDNVEQFYESLNRVRRSLDESNWTWRQPAQVSPSRGTPKSARSSSKPGNRYQGDAVKLQKIILRCQKLLDKLLDKLTDPKLTELDALKLREERDAARKDIQKLKTQLATSAKKYERTIVDLESETRVIRAHYGNEVANLKSELLRATKKAEETDSEIELLKQTLSSRDDALRTLQQKFTNVQFRLKETESANRVMQERITKLQHNLEEHAWNQAVHGVAPLH